MLQRLKSRLNLSGLSPETRTSYELGDSIRIELEVEGGDGNFSSILWSRSLISMAP